MMSAYEMLVLAIAGAIGGVSYWAFRRRQAAGTILTASSWTRYEWRFHYVGGR